MLSRNISFYKTAILVLLIFLMSILCANISFGETYTEGYFRYEIEDESIVITGYFGTSEEVIIPPMIVGYPVSKISGSFGSENNVIKKLTIPDTVMEIEEGSLTGIETVIYLSSEGENPSSGEKTEDPEKDTDTSVDPTSGNSNSGGEINNSSYQNIPVPENPKDPNGNDKLAIEVVTEEVDSIDEDLIGENMSNESSSGDITEKGALGQGRVILLSIGILLAIAIVVFLMKKRHR